MRRMLIMSGILKSEIENKTAINAFLDYKLNDFKIAFVFADGQLIEVIFE